MRDGVGSGFSGVGHRVGRGLRCQCNRVLLWGAEVALLEIAHHISREQEWHAHVAGLEYRVSKLLELSRGYCRVVGKAGKHTARKPASGVRRAFGVGVIVEVGRQAAAFKAAGNNRVVQPYLQLDSADLLWCGPMEDDAAHLTQLLAIQVESDEWEWERERAAAGHDPPHMTNALPGQGDANHPDAEYRDRTEHDSQPVVSHRFRLPENG